MNHIRFPVLPPGTFYYMGNPVVYLERIVALFIDLQDMLLLTKVAEVPTPLSVKIMQLFGPTHNYSEIVDSEIHIYIHPPIVLIIMWETCITCNRNVVREMCSLLLMGATSISGFIIINEKASKPE